MAEPSSDGPEARDARSRQALPGERFLQMLLAFLAGFILILGMGLMLAVGGGRSHLAGRLIIAVAALLLLGWLDTHATRVAQRHRPLLAPDSAGYRRYVIASAVGLVGAAGLLLGIAWFLP